MLGSGAVRTDSDLVKESYKWSVPSKPTLFVDMRALNSDKLSIRYRTSNLYKMSPTHISEAAKCVVLDVITRDVFRDKMYDSLPAPEKRVIEQFLEIIGKGSMHGYAGPSGLRELRENVAIYTGEIQAGNSNPKIRQALKEAIFEMARLKHLPAGQAKSMVLQYCT